VPKYDAFGREIGEDTLEGLGGSPPENKEWREEAYAQPQPTPEAIPPPAQPRPADPPPAEEAQRRQLAGQLSDVLQQAAVTGGARPNITVRRSGTMRGCLITLIVVVLIGAGVTVGIVNLASNIDIDTGGIEEAIKRPVVTQGPQPKGLEAGSLMRRAAIADFLRRLRADESVKLRSLYLSPARLDAQLLTRDGRIRHVQQKAGGELERFGSDSGPGFDAIPTIPYGKIDPGAPQRLARRGAKEHGIPITELQYAVPQDISGQVRWVVYFTHARYVIGDARGRFERAYN
jgi:hypothetical protein